MIRQIKIGSVYKHFKNKYYLVVDIVNDCESNNDDEYKKIVIYKALYGDMLTWARPYEMFNSEVDHNKYPDVKQHYRFEEVDIDCYLVKNIINDYGIAQEAELINLKNELLGRDIQCAYAEILIEQGNIPLNKMLRSIYNKVNFEGKSFIKCRQIILDFLSIDELNHYYQSVNKDLRNYVENCVFPQYIKNDKAHGIVHIKEVIRRSFVLNEELHVGLEPDIMYTIAAYHDIGKFENHEIHEKISAQKFLTDEKMKDFFNESERQCIAEAVEDHRSSSDGCRSVYGDMISSADRNTTIDMVFIRSFFVAHERMPEMDIDEYLDYTIKRLSKRYGDKDPESMLFKDDAYKEFLIEMRYLLQHPTDFKARYCTINNIDNIYGRVKDFPGYVE